jgi:hypothetical protein
MHTPLLEECVRHIENYALERQSFWVVEIKDAAFDYQTRMLGDRVNNLTPVFVGGKDDPTPYMPKPKPEAEVPEGEVKVKSNKQNAEKQRAASLAAKEAKAAKGGEAKAAPTENKGGKAEKVKPAAKAEKPTVESKAEGETKSKPTQTTTKPTASGGPKLTSSAVSFNGRAVVWTVQGPSSSLSPEDRKLFCENVDSALRQGVGISQGCHDQYVQSCFALNRSVVLVAGDAPPSNLTKLEAGVLKFQAGGQTKADVTGLPDPEADAFFKSVEHSIASGRGVTQAVHDKYVALCVARGRNVSHVVDPNAPKDTPKPVTTQETSSPALSTSIPITKPTQERVVSLAPKDVPSSHKPQEQASRGAPKPTRDPPAGTSEVKQVAFRMAPPETIQTLESESFDAFQARRAKAGGGPVGGAGGDGSVDQMQARAVAQQGRIQQLMETLDKEITRQMNDHAEIQRLRIANARLSLDNARLEAALKA